MTLKKLVVPGIAFVLSLTAMTGAFGLLFEAFALSLGPAAAIAGGVAIAAYLVGRDL